MADFARGQAAEGSSSPLDYAFAPRLLKRGSPPSSSQAMALASYPWVSPGDGRTRHRIILTHITTMRSQAGVTIYETGPLDWSLQPVLFLDRDDMERRKMISEYRGVNYIFQAGLDVNAVEVPDPVAEGEGRKGATVILVSTEKGTIMAFHGESLDFLGAVNRKKGFVRRLTPYYAEAGGGDGGDGGAGRLRVVASGKGGPCVWDFTDALRGGWERGREPGGAGARAWGGGGGRRPFVRKRGVLRDGRWGPQVGPLGREGHRLGCMHQSLSNPCVLDPREAAKVPSSHHRPGYSPW
jgi:hypothetical protein